MIETMFFSFIFVNFTFSISHGKKTFYLTVSLKNSKQENNLVRFNLYENLFSQNLIRKNLGRTDFVSTPTTVCLVSVTK